MLLFDVVLSDTGNYYIHGGSPPFRYSLLVLRASFRHDLMTTSILPALIYSHKAMLLAWNFFSVGSIPPKILENIYVIPVGQTSYRKKLAGAFFVFASK